MRKESTERVPAKDIQAPDIDMLADLDITLRIQKTKAGCVDVDVTVTSGNRVITIDRFNRNRGSFSALRGSSKRCAIRIPIIWRR